ncbi:tyrosine--tRNA ligase [Candidatus Woesearchaeota archaeon CG1_02_47_18]|nr:MAG: tyrosine--tRNA ligase [Candidatus Woesearchaeota archaeon CG1_02_47_18]HII29511.1 tyrosine--tRNA ligase [Candidatus Woesearchaeota archaeon]
MDTEERLKLVKSVGEEIITESELRKLLQTKKELIAYDGFEPSGQMHIAQGLLRAININRMIKAGCRFKMLVADWHAWANNKLSGDLEKIQTVGRYFIETWKACGMDLSNVDFVWANDLVVSRDYWKKVMNIARLSTVKRMMRCGQIMGRNESETLSVAQILYPCMQCADIFELKADICQLGMDQRKVNVLARELAPQLGYEKPLVVSHHMLMGLGKPATDVKDAVERAIDLKMSKSRPDSAIFMTDSEADIKRKMQNAYCPEKQISENPVLEYAKYIVFACLDRLEIKRPEKFGGSMQFEGYEELERAYAAGDLHPLDLKNAVASAINELLKPVREHFENNADAKGLFEKVKGFRVTR